MHLKNLFKLKKIKIQFQIYLLLKKVTKINLKSRILVKILLNILCQKLILIKIRQIHNLIKEKKIWKLMLEEV